MRRACEGLRVLRVHVKSFGEFAFTWRNSVEWNWIVDAELSEDTRRVFLQLSFRITFSFMGTVVTRVFTPRILNLRRDLFYAFYRIFSIFFCRINRCYLKITIAIAANRRDSISSIHACKVYGIGSISHHLYRNISLIAMFFNNSRYWQLSFIPYGIGKISVRILLS